jgi:hypothetical protein
MAGTRRVRIDRSLRQRITPRALEAFRRLKQCAAECIGEPECVPYQRCASCEAWWVQQKIIHTELALKPWEFAVEYEGMAEWEPDPAACARWRMFEEAAREPEPRPRRRGRGAHVATG